MSDSSDCAIGCTELCRVRVDGDLDRRRSDDASVDETSTALGDVRIGGPMPRLSVGSSTTKRPGRRRLADRRAFVGSDSDDVESTASSSVGKSRSISFADDDDDDEDVDEDAEKAGRGRRLSCRGRNNNSNNNKPPFRRACHVASVSDSESTASNYFASNALVTLQQQGRKLSRRQLIDLYCDQVLGIRAGVDGARQQQQQQHQHHRKIRRPSYPCLPLAHKGPIVPNRQQQLLQQRRKRSSNYNYPTAAIITSQSYCQQMNELATTTSSFPPYQPQPGSVSAVVSPCRMSPRKSFSLALDAATSTTTRDGPSPASPAAVSVGGSPEKPPLDTLSPPPAAVSPAPSNATSAAAAVHAVHLRRKNATRRVRKRSSASAAPRITSTPFPTTLRKTSRVESAVVSPLLSFQSPCSTPSPPPHSHHHSFILSPAAAAAVLPSVAVSTPSGWLGILWHQQSPVMGTKRKRKALSEGGEICLHTEDGEQRILRGGCDWGPDAVDGDHLWCPTSVSGDFCYVREQDCTRQGPRMKCSACKIIAHAGCIQHLMEKVRFTCKPTFRDVGVRAYREQTAIHHHWVHRRSQKGKCKHCGKSFQSKLSFSSKEIVAIGCSWCKAAYHNKTSCFGLHRIEEQCNLGLHGSIIVPPSWIVKLPPKGNFKSSLRKPTKKKSSSKKKKEKVSPSASASGIETGSGQGCDTNGRNVREEQKEKVNKFFAIKPIPSTKLKPVLIFINPKSGGNQGLKLMQKFQWLLNPRQVFDLTQGGPSAGLDLFRKVPNLRILACGGDGTVGWIFSELDKMGIEPPPPVGVLPLGTGNDLARALGWGGGYTDEPISKILCHIEEGDIVQLDRWTLKVEPNPEACVESQKSCGGDAAFDDGEVKDSPPLNVVNNYFSIGVDAHIALEFHEAREAHPEKFNSRIRNKMFYGQMGGKDLLQRKWKDLTDYVSLECDGKDFTSKIREHKFHALLFLNIPSYGGGTRPWNNACGKQQTDDGRLEVIGLTTYQLPLLQAGGHGTCISQCQTAKVVTRKTIPMQVDGEACRVKPSIINLSVLNKAHVVTKRRGRTSHHDGPARLEQVRLQVSRIGMADYERYHYDKEKLKEISLPLGIIVVDQEADLEQVRMHINRLWEDLSATNNASFPALSSDWCFLDSCTAERYFRIDRAQESLHYVMDISGDELNILDPDLVTTRPKADDDASTSEKDTTSANSEQHVNGGDGSLLERHSADVIAAAEKGDLKWMKDLSSKGYSLLSIDENGRTALHHAAMNGQMDIVRFLIASAPVTILDMVDAESGRTALHLAASARRRNICCMLVAAGGSLSQKDAQGQTPRELALVAGDQELANYLKSQETFQKMVSSNMETTV